MPSARRQLGGDEHLPAGDPAVADGPAHLPLVAVHGGGVDVPVADLQGRADGRLAAGPGHLPGAQADQRHGDLLAEPTSRLAAVSGHAEGPRIYGRSSGMTMSSTTDTTYSSGTGAPSARNRCVPRAGPPSATSCAAAERRT